MKDQLLQLTFQHCLKKRNRMSGKTVERDRQIPSKYIEQVIIGLVKTFKIHIVALIRTKIKLASDKFCRCVIIPPFELKYFLIESKLYFF